MGSLPASEAHSAQAFFVDLQQAFGHTLADRQGRPERLDALLTQAWDSFDGNVALQAEGEPPLDCSRGCAACCSLRVVATAPEVLAVARFLRAVEPALKARGIDLIAQVRAADRATADLSEAERVGLRQRCAFIAQGVCVIYRVRPLACRGHASHDRRACADAAAGRVDAVPYSQAHHLVRALVQNAMQSALRDAGLSWGSYELNRALCLAFDRAEALDPEQPARGQQRLEAAWLAGEDLLAGAELGEVDAQEMARVFDALKAVTTVTAATAHQAI
jgi:Fe-S-cluster containining protein